MTIKTREQIALEYGICRKTLRKWMTATGYNFPRHLTLAWQKLVYEEFSYPLGVEVLKRKRLRKLSFRVLIDD